MVTPALVVFAFVLPGVAVQGEARLRTESRMGVVSFAPGVAPAAAMYVDVVPDVGLQIFDRQVGFVARYTPRLFLRVPNPTGRPLVLHSGTLALGDRNTRGWYWSVRGRASYGDVDYASADFLFLNGQLGAVRPVAEVIRFASSETEFLLIKPLSRRDRVRASVAYSYSQPLGDTATRPNTFGTGPAFSKEHRLYFEPGYSRVLSRTDSLTLQIASQAVSFSPGPRFFGLGPSTEWQSTWARANQTTLRLGALWIQSDSEIHPSVNEMRGPFEERGKMRTRVVPDLRLSWRLNVQDTSTQVLDLTQQNPFFRIRSTLSTGLWGYYDRIRAALTPQVYLRWEIEAQPVPSLTTRAELSFYTAATKKPRDPAHEQARLRPVDPEGRPPAVGLVFAPIPETVVAIGLPVTYRVSADLDFEAGFRLSSRAPHLKSRDFGFATPEFFTYLAIVAQLGRFH